MSSKKLMKTNNDRPIISCKKLSFISSIKILQERLNA